MSFGKGEKQVCTKVPKQNDSGSKYLGNIKIGVAFFGQYINNEGIKSQTNQCHDEKFSIFQGQITHTVRGTLKGPIFIKEVIGSSGNGKPKSIS